jgi:Holliday junction resolvase RusA-like endonuclease
MVVTIPGRPVPKARPRPGRRGSFYVPSQPAQDAMAMVLSRYRGMFGKGEEVYVRSVFHVSGSRAADGDNLHKLVLDALQDAGVVPNDMRISEGHYSVHRCPKGEDRTSIVVHRRYD